MQKYIYYKNIYTKTCTCGETSHHLLRYKTYVMKILPSRNKYFLVCASCGHNEEVEDEFLLISLLHDARSIQSRVFNNTQQMEDNSLDKSIKNHIKAL